MILQLKVKRTEVGGDDYLQTLTPEEKQQVRSWRQEKEQAAKEGGRSQQPRGEASPLPRGSPKVKKTAMQQVSNGVRKVEHGVDKGVDMAFKGSLY
jgi:hypothetical protein